MNKMIERVARSIMAEACRFGSTRGDFDALHPVVQGVFISFAKAAIEAMPEPADSTMREDEDTSVDSNFGSTEGWKIEISIDAVLSE